MQIFRLFFSFFLLFALISCEKELASDTPVANSSDELTDDIKRDALTVAEAMDVEPGYWITVKGYIVAAAESSIKNADFKKPFAGKTAILLSDEPSDGTDEQEFTYLMPISLSDAAKGISASFNLQENADRWNNFVYIHGIRKQYMSAPGLKEVKHIWIGDPNEQVNPEKPDDPDNPNNPDDPDNPDNPDNPNNQDNSDFPDALTVAEAITYPTYNQIWVKGYIIATVHRSMSLKNINFEPPFENYSIILADEPVNEENIDNYKMHLEQLLPVNLTVKEFEGTRKMLNLNDNPQLHNKLVYILGEKNTYLSRPGINPAAKAIIP